MHIFFFFFHHTCESMCDTLASSAANQGNNTVSVAQGGTATPGATEQLLPPDRISGGKSCSLAPGVAVPPYISVCVHV